LQTANAGTDDDADFVAVFLCEVEPGIQQRLIRGINTKLRKNDPCDGFPWMMETRAWDQNFHFAGDWQSTASHQKELMRFNATLTGNEVVPENVELMSQRRYHAEAGDDDTAFVEWLAIKNQTGNSIPQSGTKLPETFKAATTLLMFFDVFDDIADRCEFLGLFIRHLDAELLLQRHDQLDCVERIRTEVLDEFRLRRYLIGLHAELFDDDVLYTWSIGLSAIS